MMPTISSSRSSRRTARRAGGVACGGNGPQALVGAVRAWRCIAMTAPYTEVVLAAHPHHHLHLANRAVARVVGGDVADAVAAPDVGGNLVEGGDPARL